MQDEVFLLNVVLKHEDVLYSCMKCQNRPHQTAMITLNQTKACIAKFGQNREQSMTKVK